MKHDISSMSTYSDSRLRWLLKLLGWVCVLLIIRVLVEMLSQYRFYFPPDFQRADFLVSQRAVFSGVYSFGFYLHIISAPLALLLVGVLLCTRNSQRLRRLHKISGHTLIILTVFAVCPGGILIASNSVGGPIAATGFVALAIVTGISAVLTGWCARRKNFKRHKIWACRITILLCSPILLRLGVGLFSVMGIESLSTYQFLAWASWLLPLTVFEFWRIGRSGNHDIVFSPEEFFSP